MRDRAAAEIEAEKQRAIADLRAEVADLALRAAGRVVGETMTDDRQRRLVEEFLTETGRRPAEGAGELMARRDSAPRRYAEAAFELALRDDTVETWRASSTRPRPSLDDGELGRPRQPGPAARAAGGRPRRASSPSSATRSATSSCCSLRRGRIEQLPRVAAEFAGSTTRGRGSPTPPPRARRR